MKPFAGLETAERRVENMVLYLPPFYFTYT